MRNGKIFPILLSCVIFFSSAMLEILFGVALWQKDRSPHPPSRFAKIGAGILMVLHRF
jgi:hypothetical protein